MKVCVTPAIALSVSIGYIIDAMLIPEGGVPEWATAVTIAGLAAIMTGPILRGYDRKNRDREANAESGGEREPPITRDLRTWFCGGPVTVAVLLQKEPVNEALYSSHWYCHCHCEQCVWARQI